MKIKNIFLAISIVMLSSTFSCTNLVDDSYGSVISENYTPSTETDKDVLPARTGIGWVDGYVYKRMHEHTWTSSDDGVLQPWSRTFEGVNTCNRIIYQIETGKIVVSDQRKIELIAELKVLRASYYYILVDLYGNVPIVVDFSDTSLPKQSTRSEVFDFIVKEIKDNVELLSETPRGLYYGRINKWVANTLLAKMYGVGKLCGLNVLLLAIM